MQDDPVQISRLAINVVTVDSDNTHTEDDEELLYGELSNGEDVWIYKNHESYDNEMEEKIRNLETGNVLQATVAQEDEMSYQHVLIIHDIVN